MKAIATVLLIFVSYLSNADQTATVGIEVDTPFTYYFGSYAPGGIASISIATYNPWFGIKANVGGFPKTPHFAVSLEGSENTCIKFEGNWLLLPHIGFSVARSTPYDRLTKKYRRGENGEYIQTYLYASGATSRQVFAGARLQKITIGGTRVSIALGLLHEYAFSAKNMEEREICMGDNCGPGQPKLSGMWPDPKNAFYVTVSWELDFLGNRRH